MLIRNEYEAGLEKRCAFCREPVAKSKEEAEKNSMKRIMENNDPAAMCRMGRKNHKEGNYKSAIKYWTKAAELGDAMAHFELSITYRDGEGVGKDEKKAIHHLEEAAMAGLPMARHNLGCIEGNKCRFDRAKKHFIIAANLGFRDSLNCLMKLYAGGHASKEDYTDALRAYQAAADATKSAEREKAEKVIKNGGANCIMFD
jgi:TPR repeat protein